MEWISQIWVWVLFFVGLIAMHMFGHGGVYGGDRTYPKSKSKDSGQSTSEQEPGHKH